MISRTDRSTNANRVVATVGTAILQALFAYALMTAFSVRIIEKQADTLKTFNLASAPPPPKVEAPKPQPSARKTSGRASPPNLRARATPIVAPLPVVPLVIPPPIMSAPVAGPGAEASGGAADLPGPGTGAGGLGNGTGSGGSGAGDGSGDKIPLKWLSGRLRDSDYPLSLYEAGIGGTVTVRFRVDIDGRVRECLIDQSSGIPELDDMTCRLIRQRYRFRAPRDAGGRPKTAIVIEDHEWIPHPRGQDNIGIGQ